MIALEPMALLDILWAPYDRRVGCGRAVKREVCSGSPQLNRIAFRASELQNPWDYLYDVTDGYFCAISPSPLHEKSLCRDYTLFFVS